MNDDTAPGSHAVRGGVHGFWGKIRFDQAGKVESWLPLASHSLDVAMVFRRLVGLPTFRKRLEAAAGRGLVDAQCDRPHGRGDLGPLSLAHAEDAHAGGEARVEHGGLADPGGGGARDAGDVVLGGECDLGVEVGVLAGQAAVR
jgi:hypothetical protein